MRRPAGCITGRPLASVRRQQVTQRRSPCCGIGSRCSSHRSSVRQSSSPRRSGSRSTRRTSVPGPVHRGRPGGRRAQDRQGEALGPEVRRGPASRPRPRRRGPSASSSAAPVRSRHQPPTTSSTTRRRVRTMADPVDAIVSPQGGVWVLTRDGVVRTYDPGEAGRRAHLRRHQAEPATPAPCLSSSAFPSGRPPSADPRRPAQDVDEAAGRVVRRAGSRSTMDEARSARRSTPVPCSCGTAVDELRPHS